MQQRFRCRADHSDLDWVQKWRHRPTFALNLPKLIDESLMQNRLMEVWREAAADLGIEVVVPYLFQSNGFEYQFVALITGFGSRRGTLVCLSEEFGKILKMATQSGFYCYGIDAESGDRYDREKFIQILNELGWYGDLFTVPTWYQGES